VKSALVFLLALGCSSVGAVRGTASAVDDDLRTARDQNAETCAPRELAVAESNLAFARLALDEGDSQRADEHVALAARSAREAVAKSKECARVKVVVREQAPPPKVTAVDTDRDGVPDVEDQCPNEPGPKENHGCPVAAPSAPPQKLVIVRRDRIEIRQQVRFRPNRSEILPSSYELLRQVANVIKAAPAITVRIEGHTDNVGKKQKNMRLSQQRADAVKTFLVRQGIDEKRLVAQGFGPTRPVASNATRAGKAANRRVEFRIVQPDASPPAAPGAAGTTPAAPAPRPPETSTPPASTPAPNDAPPK
jgi:outer membrane protein OmpA-like peptidoglycan-associated protein